MKNYIDEIYKTCCHLQGDVVHYKEPVTILTCAVENNHLDIVELLLECRIPNSNMYMFGSEWEKAKELAKDKNIMTLLNY